MRAHFLVFAVATIAACASAPEEPETVEEEYWGMPDLAIQAFIPPVLLAGEGDTIYISHLVENIGDGVSGETQISYYISNTAPVDVATSMVIGGQTVPSLKPGESAESMEQAFVIPAGVGSPPVYLAACVDVNDLVEELRDDNNCTVNRSGDNQMPFDSGAVMSGSSQQPDWQAISDAVE